MYGTVADPLPEKAYRVRAHPRPHLLDDEQPAFDRLAQLHMHQSLTIVSHLGAVAEALLPAFCSADVCKRLGVTADVLVDPRYDSLGGEHLATIADFLPASARGTSGPDEVVDALARLLSPWAEDAPELAGRELLTWPRSLPFPEFPVPAARVQNALVLKAGFAHCSSVVFDWDSDAFRTQLCAVLDIGMARASSLTKTALMSLLVLPRVTALARAGLIDSEKLIITARTAANLPVIGARLLDAHIAALPHGLTVRSVRRYCEEFTALYTVSAEADDLAMRNRRVELEDFGDGRGMLTAIGPIHLLAPLKKRLSATARAIRHGNARAFQAVGEQAELFNDADADGHIQLSADTALDDDRAIHQTEFDLLVGHIPETTVQLGDSSQAGPVEAVIRPTAKFIAEHCRVVVTVPAAALEGRAELPATMDGAPISPRTARVIASHASSWWRLLTNSDGTITDDPALRYTPTRAMRIAVREAYGTCTAPGCHRSAVTCDLDHIEPFDHRDPTRGGRTHPSNLHPLCRMHHQHKTTGTLRVKRLPDGALEWTMPDGTTAVTRKRVSLIRQINNHILAAFGFARAG